jgi:membrane protein DedA with SNARE-associated domain
MEQFIQSLSTVSPLWIYVTLFIVAYIENLFPPFPSDVIIVFAASLIPMGNVKLIPALFFAAVGGTFGFMTMYGIGLWFGHKIIERGRIKFIPLDKIHKVEAWFRRFGYSLIIANRFLSGTRAIVSFFAGISELKFLHTSLLSFGSALVWNFILIYGGKELGQNWHIIIDYTKSYSLAITLIIILVALFFLFAYFLKRKEQKMKNNTIPK